ncbi:MAG: hypothetical protein HDT32_06720 [Clostridiales bacterium]|nr:hypothetical protein [Clostridiales bacterium]
MNANCDLTTNSFVNTNDVLPQSAIKISDADDLKSFLTGHASYGYVAADISLDWEEVGSPINFANGRTLDGRGHVLTLTDKQACADVYDDEMEALNMNGEGETSECDYGLFVSVNNGIIKNFKFAYDDEICAVNSGISEINGVGIVCGKNNGVIANCELSASGAFSYFYINSDANDGQEYQTNFGGFAGINRGSIDRVSASYYDFTLRVRTLAHSWDFFSDGITAKTFAGGVAGNISDSGECTNATVFGNNALFHLTADKVGNRESFVYSGAIAAYSEGRIDNIIVDFSPEYVQYSDEVSVVSRNAVVQCGSATNVTALNTYGGGINLQSNGCGCAEHIGYCNVIKTDEYTKAVIYIDEDNNQVIELTPIKGLIERVSFTKLTTDGSGKIIDDNAFDENSPNNFYSHSFASECANGKTFQIKPYQNSCKCFWEIEARSWQKAEIEFSQETRFNYTGKDILQDIVKFRVDDGSYLKCDFTKMNLLNDDVEIYEAINVGRYNLSIRPIEIDGVKYLYYDEENHIMAIAPENYYNETREYYIVKNLIVTADWFDIEDNAKDYDGTDEFDVNRIKWNNGNENVIENLAFLPAVDYNAYYSQSDAGEDIQIIIELQSQAQEIVINNKIIFVKGIIRRRQVNLTLNYAEATYGGAIEYHYYADNVIDGDSVDVVFCSNILMSEAQKFKFWIEESEFGNYSIANFEKLHGYDNGAPLILHKAVISQLANLEEDFADLNTQNVKDLQIKFRDVIDDKVFHILDLSYYDSDKNDYLPIEEINSAGTYKIRLSIPKEMQLIYELDESLAVIEITVSQADNTPNDNEDGDNDDSSSEITKDNDKIDFGDNSENANSSNNYTDYSPGDVKEKSYGGIAIAVGVTSTALVAVGILKRVLSKRKLKPRK